MKKTRLLTPGPTEIPGAVLSKLSQPIIHHRTVAFEELFADVRKGLQHLFQTQQDVLLLTATGTGAMEAAVCNLFCKGDSVIIVNGGKFGERWTQIARAYGLQPIEILLKPGATLQIHQLIEVAEKHKSSSRGMRAILFQASETSTGVRMPTEEICQVASEYNMLSVCDAITACGVFQLPMDRWGIDVMLTGSQKALMIPPGLAMIALSEKAWNAQKISDLPKFYFDLAHERKTQVKNQTAWTPAISLIQGLHESLKMIREEGLENAFRRHAQLAQATRNAVAALGLEILAQESPSDAVTAVKVPPTIKDGKQIPILLQEKYGVTLVGGQDELAGKIFRLAHIGYSDRFDIITAIAALELVLNDLGYSVELGTGVSAALKACS